MRPDKAQKLRPGQPNPLTDKEKAFILKHYKTQTVTWIASKLYRGEMKIYEHMDQEGLQAFNPNYFGRKRKKTTRHR